jgi:hypothetical protein
MTFGRKDESVAPWMRRRRNVCRKRSQVTCHAPKHHDLTGGHKIAKIDEKNTVGEIQ